ncbi:MAG: hypothetical protein ACXW2E_01400 [Nitrososphaeraceae archaeon]
MKKYVDKIIHERGKVSSGSYHDIRRHRANLKIWDDVGDDDSTIISHSSKQLEPMRKIYISSYTDRSQDRSYKYVYRYVAKQVGRKWDDIYSEFCSLYTKRSPTQLCVFDALDGSVDKDIRIYNNRLYIVNRWYRILLEESYTSLYVDPRDGILKQNNSKSGGIKSIYRYRRAADREQELTIKRVIDSHTELHLIQGIWFEIKFSDDKCLYCPAPSYYAKRPYLKYKFDSIRHKYNNKRCIESQRTLSKKELKKLGISNLPNKHIV